MREDVGDDAGLAVPARNAVQHRRLLQRRPVVLRGEPVRGRHLGHAAEQAFFGTGADQQPVAARDDERRATSQRTGLLRGLARKRFLIAARAAHTVAVQRTQRAGRFLRGADRGAQVHQRLRAVAGARVLVAGATCSAEQRHRQLLNQRLGLRQRLLDREQPRHHALDIAVDRHGAAAEGNRRYGGGGIRPDPRQRAQTLLGIRKHPAMIAPHRHRAGVQIARAGIIAEPGPHPQHVVERGTAERFDVGPARQKFQEIRPHRFDAGLLQHDFRQPDANRDRRVRPAAAAMAGGGDGGHTIPAAARDGRRRLGRCSASSPWSLTMRPHLILRSDSWHDQRAWGLQGITRRVIVGHDSELCRFRNGIDLDRTSEPKITAGHPEYRSQKTAPSESGTGIGRSSRTARQSPRSAESGSPRTAFDPDQRSMAYLLYLG